MEVVSGFTGLKAQFLQATLTSDTTTSSGSPGDPHFCPTWLQSQGFPQPSPGFDNLLAWLTEKLTSLSQKML